MSSGRQQFALTPRNATGLPQIQDQNVKVVRAPYANVTSPSTSSQNMGERSSQSSQFNRKFIKRDLFNPGDQQHQQVMITTPDSSRQTNTTYGLPFFRGSTGESSSFNNEQILDRLEKLREKRGMRLKKISNHHRRSIDQPQESQTSTKKNAQATNQGKYIFQPLTTSTQDVVNAYESFKDRQIVKKFFDRRTKSKKRMGDIIKRSESLKNSSIDIQTFEKRLIEPYLAHNNNKRQITPKTQNKPRVINFRQGNIDSGSSINFDKSMNNEQLPQMPGHKTLSSGGVRNLRSYSSSNLGGNSRVQPMKTIPQTTNKDHSPAPITQTEFQSIIEKYRAKALADASSSIVTNSHGLTLIPEQQQQEEVLNNNQSPIQITQKVNENRLSPMRQSLYANAEKVQRTKTREFLKSVMNAGQPYVEKNKYIGEMGKTTKNSYVKLRKSGTETSSHEQNRRFQQSKKTSAVILSASAGEQDD